MSIWNNQKKLLVGMGILLTIAVVIGSFYLIQRQHSFHPVHSNRSALNQSIVKREQYNSHMTRVQQSVSDHTQGNVVNNEQNSNIPLLQTKSVQDRLKQIAHDRRDVILSIEAMSRLILTGNYPEIRKTLSNDLTVTTWQISLNAAKGLAIAGDYSGFDTVKRVLATGEWSAKIDAAKTMGLFGNEGKTVLETLTNNPDSWIKLGAEAGLARLGDKQAADALTKGLSSVDSATRDYCARSLAEIGDKRAKSYFDNLFASNDPYLKAEGAQYLYLLGDEKAKAYLTAMLEDVDPYWQNYAVIAITKTL